MKPTRQVVREYKRANMLIRPTATSARVWVSLYAEIEKVGLKRS